MESKNDREESSWGTPSQKKERVENLDNPEMAVASEDKQNGISQSQKNGKPRQTLI